MGGAHGFSVAEHPSKRAAADALAELVTDPAPDRIIPGAFDPGVAEAVADAVRRTVLESGRTLNR